MAETLLILFKPPRITIEVKIISNRPIIALDNKLVILGLKSKEPNINYGYIKYKKNYIYKDSFEVGSFIEKPKKSTASKLCKIGALWNLSLIHI